MTTALTTPVEDVPGDFPDRRVRSQLRLLGNP
jgi:hypothetical protein